MHKKNYANVDFSAITPVPCPLRSTVFLMPKLMQFVKQAGINAVL